MLLKEQVMWMCFELNYEMTVFKKTITWFEPTNDFYVYTYKSMVYVTYNIEVARPRRQKFKQRCLCTYPFIRIIRLCPVLWWL